MRVTLLEKDSRTGIGSYAAGLRRHLPPAAQVEVRRVVKHEVRVLGVRLGGAVSQHLCLLDRPLPPDGQVVHATSNWAFHRRANLLTIHDLNPLLLRQSWTDRLMFRLQGRRIRRLPALVTDSNAIRLQVAERYRVAEEDIHAIPIGVEQDPPAGRERLAWKGPTVVYAGALMEYKMVREAILALEGLPGVHFVRCGPPPRGAEAEATLRLGVERLGNRFHDRGYVGRDDLRRLYAAADLLYFPSRFEGFGLPPLEAAVCGTPSLLSPTALMRELHGDTAHYAGELTVAGLRDAIRRALDAPIPAARLRRNAARFTWERAAREHLQVYRKVVEAA